MSLVFPISETGHVLIGRSKPDTVLLKNPSTNLLEWWSLESCFPPNYAPNAVRLTVAKSGKGKAYVKDRNVNMRDPLEEATVRRLQGMDRYIICFRNGSWLTVPIKVESGETLMVEAQKHFPNDPINYVIKITDAVA